MRYARKLPKVGRRRKRRKARNWPCSTVSLPPVTKPILKGLSLAMEEPGTLEVLCLKPNITNKVIHSKSLKRISHFKAGFEKSEKQILVIQENVLRQFMRNWS